MAITLRGSDLARFASLKNDRTVPDVLSAGNVNLNLSTFELSVADETIPTSYQEFEVLRELLENQGRIIPLAVLTSLLWNDTGRAVVRRLNVIMHRLRVKLAVSSPYRLRTVRNRGYGLIATGGNQSRGGGSL